MKVPPLPPGSDSRPTFPPRTDAARESSNGEGRGAVAVVRLPGLSLAEQRIRRAIRRLRESVLPEARSGFAKEQIEEVVKDLHVAIDAIQ